MLDGALLNICFSLNSCIDYEVGLNDAYKSIGSIAGNLNSLSKLIQQENLVI